VYESKFRNPNAGYLEFDEASILTSYLDIEEPNFCCRLQIFTIAKKAVFERSNANHLGTTTFKLYELISDDKILQTVFPFESQLKRKTPEPLDVEFSGLKVVAERKNFLDYVYGGLEIALSVAIDYSASNGELQDPTSLHTFDEAKNKYLQAIKSVVTIM